MRSWLKRQIYKRVTSLSRRDGARTRLVARRQARGEPRTLHYFHRFGDPASAITAPLLARMAARFDVVVVCHLVGDPDPAVVPEPAQLETFARVDADRLARRMGLDFRDPGGPVGEGRIDLAERAVLDRLEGADALGAICHIDAALWSGEAIVDASSRPADAVKHEGARLRDRLGHFQSGTVWYEGEWYWSADRLHYLEARLETEGARLDGEAADAVAPVLHETQAEGDVHGACLEFYPSLRSPYTYLAAERTYLAWVRTSLALVGFGLMYIKLVGTNPNAHDFRALGSA